MKKIVLLICLIFVCWQGSFAQTKDFRSAGYKGSVSITDQMGVFVGLETSQGYMINRHMFLGVGAGAFMFPNGRDYPAFSEAFLDYNAYVLDKQSTPTAGLKIGMIHALGFGQKVGEFEHKYAFQNGVAFEPSFGWNWALNKRYGLSVNIGASIIVPFGENKGTSPSIVLPKLSLAFEF